MCYPIQNNNGPVLYNVSQENRIGSPWMFRLFLLRTIAQNNYVANSDFNDYVTVVILSKCIAYLYVLVYFDEVSRPTHIFI